ncbi:MAG TPA: DUF1294 domain-containing protein [Clostridia bacterium]|nr:DUF1294 domain-containing protein [Clostridia bacterium]
MTAVVHARRHIVATAMILTMGPAVGVMFLLHSLLPALDWLQCWLLSITGITFLVYGYDKLIAGTQATRVPEKVLLTLAFTGGTLGAIAGMRFFHHKTSKESFLERFWLIVVAQIVVIAGWYVFLRPR